MATRSVPCMQCNVTMEEGMILDKAGYGGIVQGEWTKGTPPRRGIWGRFLSGSSVSMEQYADSKKIIAYRCPSCGRLELYAPQS